LKDIHPKDFALFLAMLVLFFACICVAQADTISPAQATLPKSILVNGQDCRVRVNCPPLHPVVHKPKPKLSPVVPVQLPCIQPAPIVLESPPISFINVDAAPVPPPTLVEVPSDAPPTAANDVPYGGGAVSTVDESGGIGYVGGGYGGHRGRPRVPGSPHTHAHEIDPAGTVTAITALLLGLVIVASRFKRTKQ
jgi:hypothetical protein